MSEQGNMPEDEAPVLDEAKIAAAERDFREGRFTVVPRSPAHGFPVFDEVAIGRAVRAALVAPDAESYEAASRHLHGLVYAAAHAYAYAATYVPRDR